MGWRKHLSIRQIRDDAESSTGAIPEFEGIADKVFRTFWGVEERSSHRVASSTATAV